MLTERYTPERMVRELRAEGLELFVVNGAVHGKCRPGVRMSMRARELASELQGMNDEVARILMREAEGPALIVGGKRVEHLGLTVEQAMALGDRINAGEMELEGMVHYHQSTGLVDMVTIEREAAE